LHLLFVSRAGARAVEQQRRLSASSLRAGDLAFAAGLVVSGLFRRESCKRLWRFCSSEAGAAAGSLGARHRTRNVAGGVRRRDHRRRINFALTYANRARNDTSVRVNDSRAT
jgi:hypothetical protein